MTAPAVQNVLPGIVAGTCVAAAAALGLIIVVLHERRRRVVSPGGDAPRARRRGAADAPPGGPAAAEELPGDLEQRIRRLQKLIADADGRIDELRRLAAAREDDAGLYQPDGPDEQARAEIIRLGRQGLEAVEIARRMDVAVGEVELVINLGRRAARQG